jgi:hypothetical protein
MKGLQTRALHATQRLINRMQATIVNFEQAGSYDFSTTYDDYDSNSQNSH